MMILKAKYKSVAENLKAGSAVVIKSTVPVGTHIKIRDIISSTTSKEFHMVSNPEFLKEGSAIGDFMKPDRVIIGCEDDTPWNMMEELYAPLVRQGNPIYRMSNLSAEVTKYAANCFLATKISFINEIARFCEKSGADIEEVRQGITSDQRIGKHFFYPGLGYGGSCFPKDVKALVSTAREFGMALHITESAQKVNDEQKTILARKVYDSFGEDLSGKTFAFWGVAFKPGTDDIREAPSLYMAKELISKGAKVNIYDPVAIDNFLGDMGDYASSIERFQDKYQALEGAEALIVITEWPEFRSPDFDKLKTSLKTNHIFDGRNIFPTDKVKELGFTYHAIGKRV